MNQKKLYIFLLFIIVPVSLFSQLSAPGIPLSFSSKLKRTIEIPTTELQVINVEKLVEEDSITGITNRFAVNQFVTVDVKKKGIETKTVNGRYWQYRFIAPNSYSLGILFSSFKIPKGADVYVYNNTHSILHGAFTSINNKKDGILAVAQHADREAIIEYYEPDSVEFGGELIISSVSLAYRDMSSILDYNDVTCSRWADWSVVKKSVCRMIYNDGSDSYYCSGSLINNLRFDSIPYFLTANHCINKQYSASTLVTYFNYETTTCNGVVQNTKQTLSGAMLLSHSPTNDYSFLQLNEMPDSSYKPYYAGWDASGNDPGITTVIHHPKGLRKSIAQSNTKARIYPYSISWDYGGDTPPNSHWEVTFTDGTTDNGSSGSPILDKNKRIVGQLHGGDNETNYYGVFSYTWKYIKKWLDPDFTEVKMLDGLSGKIIPVANFSFSTDYACKASRIHLFDSSLYLPTSWHWDISPSDYELLDNTTAESQAPAVQFLRDTIYDVMLTVSNKQGSNSISRQIHIGALKFSIAQFPEEKEICGLALNNANIKLSGKYDYSVTTDKDSLLEVSLSGNNIILSLKENAYNGSSFTTKITAIANQGNCVAYDSLDLEVMIASHDMVRNAKMLRLGESGPFYNECASVETNEPHPQSVGCLVKDSWCLDSENPDTVINNTLWFQFYGPSTELINIEAHGFDTRIAVYKAESYNSLLSNNYELIAANDNKEISNTYSLLKNVKVVHGEKYWLQLDGFKHEEGEAYINLYSNALEVYPNPTKRKFTLIVSLSESSEGNIKIISSTGKTVYAANTDISIAKNAIDVDLSVYPPGLYLIYCTINGQTYTSKIMLIR